MSADQLAQGGTGHAACMVTARRCPPVGGLVHTVCAAEQGGKSKRGAWGLPPGGDWDSVAGLSVRLWGGGGTVLGVSNHDTLSREPRNTSRTDTDTGARRAPKGVYSEKNHRLRQRSFRCAQRLRDGDQHWALQTAAAASAPLTLSVRNLPSQPPCQELGRCQVLPCSLLSISPCSRASALYQPFR